MGICESQEQVVPAANEREQVLQTLRLKFAKYDEDGSGEIASGELAKLVKDVMGHKMTKMELKAALRQLDKDGTGSISWKEFKDWFFQDEEGEGQGDDDDDEEEEEEKPKPKPKKKKAKQPSADGNSDSAGAAYAVTEGSEAQGAAGGTGDADDDEEEEEEEDAEAGEDGAAAATAGDAPAEKQMQGKKTSRRKFHLRYGRR